VSAIDTIRRNKRRRDLATKRKRRMPLWPFAVLGVFWLAFRDAASHSRLVQLAFGGIVGGAIGNIVDRLHYPFVVDFIDFYRIWPNVFNIADSCITAGVILLIISSLATSRRKA